MAAQINAVVELHQGYIEVTFLGGFMGLQFRLELFVCLDPLRRIAAGTDQRFGISALAFMAFAQGFKNVHGFSSSSALWAS
ncbi:hypothetical protein D3C78_1901550 [compost metagenome]